MRVALLGNNPMLVCQLFCLVLTGPTGLLAALPVDSTSKARNRQHYPQHQGYRQYRQYR